MPPRIDSFLRLVADQKASDLHFSAGSVPAIRLDGDLVPLPFRKLSADEARKFLFEIMSKPQRAIFERDQEIDFAHNVEGVGRFRVNIAVQTRGVGAVFRVIPNHPPTIAELGLPRTLLRLAALPNGLVIVSGPTGSGKTTTLAALIHEINRSRPLHVITVEDPIEYIHPPLVGLVTQREIGSHTESFSAALRAALRESPDVIVVGELRDVDTVMLALSAAETGVLVFGTLHTNSAAKCIDRIIDICPEDMHAQVRTTLGTQLKGIIAQHLLKRVTGEGMVAAVELLLPGHGLGHLIRDNKTHLVDQLIRTNEAEGDGTQSLDLVLCRYVQQGLIAVDDALALARDPAAVRAVASAADA
jgi:twitching motility protein PilT